MEEVWLDICGYGDCYQASSEGRIRSKDKMSRNRHGPCILPGRVLKPWIDNREFPYQRVRLYPGGGYQNAIPKMVHHLVAEAFYGPMPDGHEVHHKNEDTLNNCPQNLEYVSIFIHRSSHKKGRKFSHTPRVLNKDSVNAMRRDLETGHFTMVSIAQAYGVSVKTVRDVKYGRSWNS